VKKLPDVFRFSSRKYAAFEIPSNTATKAERNAKLVHSYIHIKTAFPFLT